MRSGRDNFLADHFFAFATVAAITLVQDLLAEAKGQMRGMDAARAVEDTLCLAAQVTYCAGEEGGADAVRMANVTKSIPVGYLDYAMGVAAAREGDVALLEERTSILSRIERNQLFYAQHLPDSQHLSRQQLQEKLELWVGRISPPGLPDKPIDRLQRMAAEEVIRAHMLVVRAKCQQVMGTR